MLEDLRLLMLIMAVVGVFFIVFDGIRRKLRRDSATSEFGQTVFDHPDHHVSTERDDPLFTSHELKATVEVVEKKNINDIEKNRAKNKQPSPAIKAPEIAHEVITIAIKSRHRGGFSGRILESALKSHEFIFGEKKIFHRYHNDDPQQAVLYSVAQSTEPGIFDLEKMKYSRVPGIVIFMIMPIDSKTPLLVFEQMLKNARQLAAALNGELCDGRHNSLSTQTLEHLREKVQENHRKNLAMKAS